MYEIFTGDVFGTISMLNTRSGHMEYFWKQEEMFEDAKIQVKPVASQGVMESRRVWLNVSRALAQGDYARATEYKNQIEREQRIRRNQMETQRLLFQPQMFVPTGNAIDNVPEYVVFK